MVNTNNKIVFPTTHKSPTTFNGDTNMSYSTYPVPDELTQQLQVLLIIMLILKY